MVYKKTEYASIQWHSFDKIMIIHPSSTHVIHRMDKTVKYAFYSWYATLNISLLMVCYTKHIFTHGMLH